MPENTNSERREKFESYNPYADDLKEALANEEQLRAIGYGFAALSYEVSKVQAAIHFKK